MSQFCSPLYAITDDRMASRTDFVKALDSIHRAGYGHGNITRRNLLLSRVNDGVAIVALGDAQPTTDSKTERDELAKLLGLLPNTMKRTGDGNHTLDFLKVYLNIGFSTSGNNPDPSSPDKPRPKKGRYAICDPEVPLPSPTQPSKKGKITKTNISTSKPSTKRNQGHMGNGKSGEKSIRPSVDQSVDISADSVSPL
jgi:hypothetical protein